MTRSLIENSISINIHSLKKDLKEARLRKPVDGCFNVRNNGRSGILNYRLEYEDGKIYLTVFADEIPQRIELVEHGLRYGERFYLLCGCGTRNNSLYLKGKYFACRHCQKLTYKSTTINPRSDSGALFDQHNRLLKVMDYREAIGNRIFYRSKYTKKFNRFMKLCTRAGLYQEVIAALKLLEMINERRLQ